MLSDFFSFIQSHALYKIKEKIANELWKGHPAHSSAHVLDQQRDATVKVPHVALEDKVLLGLCRDARFEVTQPFLSWR